VCNGASGLTPTCAEAHDGAEPERKSNSFAPTEGCWLAHTLFVLTSPSLGSTVDFRPGTSLLSLGFRNYSFFGPNPSYGFIPRQLSGIPECDLFAQPFRIESEGKEVQPVGAETNSNN